MDLKKRVESLALPLTTFLKKRAERLSLSLTAFLILSVLGAVALGHAVIGGVFYFGPVYLPHAPTQPIAFSHKLHAGTNKIPCQYCHSDARRTESAGIPTAKKCMNCHVVVKTESPEVVKIAAAYDGGKPIEWARVYKNPDHVWFSHKRHIKKGVECQTCHGPVETMEVVSRSVNHQMGFCLSCHRAKKAPTDCWTCHT